MFVVLCEGLLAMEDGSFKTLREALDASLARCRWQILLKSRLRAQFGDCTPEQFRDALTRAKMSGIPLVVTTAYPQPLRFTPGEASTIDAQVLGRENSNAQHFSHSVVRVVGGTLAAQGTEAVPAQRQIDPLTDFIGSDTVRGTHMRGVQANTCDCDAATAPVTRLPPLPCGSRGEGKAARHMRRE